MRKLIAWLKGLHRHCFRTKYDDTGIWGECVFCHRRVGFVDSATLRAFADREYKRARLKP
jgi:hypothetical protein